MQIAVIGFGLIGGSALLAWQGLREQGEPQFQELMTTAMDLSPATLDFAKAHHLADRVTQSVKEAVSEADVIVVTVSLPVIGNPAASAAMVEPTIAVK